MGKTGNTQTLGSGGTVYLVFSQYILHVNQEPAINIGMVIRLLQSISNYCNEINIICHQQIKSLSCAKQD